MAVKKVIQIAADTAQATKEIKELFKDLLEKQEKADKQQEELNENVKDLGESAKKSEKGINAISKGFKGLGLAIKAAGIGLVLSLLATLKEVFMQNQKVADTFATAMETVSIVFNELVEVFINVFEQTQKNSKGFEALGKVLMGIITLAITPFKLQVLGIALAFKKAQLAWEQSFFGSKDKGKIAELTEDINGIVKNIEETGKKAIEAGKDVYNNFGEAAGAIGSIVEGTIDGISEISLKGAYESAKANTQLKNNAQLAAAEQGRLVEIYDRQAEKLRQIRDNELISISERQKANDALGEVLEKQEKAMLAQANLQIAAAQAAVDKNRSIENQVALTDALANKEGILAQIEGFRSEQDVNRNALIKERIDLKNAELEADANLSLEQKRFNAEQIEDEELRLERLRELIQEEKDIERERLEAKRDQYAEGTQARTDAEIELKERMAELDMEYTSTEIELSNLRIKQAEAEKEAKVKIQNATLDTVANGIGLLKQLAGENKEIQAALLIAESAAGIAKTVINTGVANAKALAVSPMTLGQPWVTLNTINAGIGIASTVAATAKGLSALGKSGGGANAGAKSALKTGGATSAPQPSNPSFNLVGNSQANQLAGALNQGGQPVRAYVVSRNMSSQQEMDRNIRQTASVG